MSEYLYKVLSNHIGPKDQHEAIETYLIAKDDESVAEWINKNKVYGHWFEEDEDEEYFDDDHNLISRKEWIMLNHGDFGDEYRGEDGYYGHTFFGWEMMITTPEEMGVLLNLSIAKKILYE